MAFRRPYPRQRRTCEEYKAELEEENYHLHSELQTEVDTNRQNERWINQLERDYSQCEQEIQDLNREIELLENASKEEIVELKSEISTLKSQLYQARKDVRDKGKHGPFAIEKGETAKKIKFIFICQIWFLGWNMSRITINSKKFFLAVSPLSIAKGPIMIVTKSKDYNMAMKILIHSQN